ncbi:MAG: Cell envelope-related transcriptional attenuator [Candidatus Roizmanbacteria bacterium GW2011_GWC2_37_13]|uniref:Cell envelope-related transcriptional attenuator n=1 Tax=Candidatus Roizmanbacteria bacterium GW2011_GWC2_37_13 TaxID=1618486 RepID=A0A0G0G693_9BACT|nr:MAG: cell envelope-related transcriptional attenuator [Candidatus Roizmanbacteria bacterium GW2011_GWC1_37_12]KKQ26593.1 MAG: Cell envelope-related transcriptional attenuator [Candidatus Roizmanbacteria bacterium GW2011_GWC2_37_13]
MALRVKLFITGLVILIILILVARPYLVFIKKTLKISIVKTLLSKDSLVTYDNQVNILLMGIAGGSHEGPNLSDTNIVVNYNFKTNKLTTISIPRDIWSETLKDKINSAYAYGEAKKPNGGGFVLAKAEIEAIVGLPIQYAAVIDFQQFKELIDFLGGIEVDVENSFVDKKFPIDGKENDECNGDETFACRFETVSFTKGKTVMDGKTTLKFIRSRNAEGDEGTDFAREKRQQKMIDGVKNKLTKLIIKPNLKTYQQVYDLLDKLIRRDLSNQQVAIIAKNIFFKGNSKQEKILLSENFFSNPPISEEYDNLWVLIPADKTYTTVHAYIDCNLRSQSDCESLKNKGKKN